jgi:hypothetical protein
MTTFLVIFVIKLIKFSLIHFSHHKYLYCNDQLVGIFNKLGIIYHYNHLLTSLHRIYKLTYMQSSKLEISAIGNNIIIRSAPIRPYYNQLRTTPIFTYSDYAQSQIHSTFQSILLNPTYNYNQSHSYTINHIHIQSITFLHNY